MPSPEIIFLGKEETKWTEEREVSLPLIVAQGFKQEPSAEAFDLREDQIGLTKKMSPPQLSRAAPTRVDYKRDDHQ